MTHSFAMCLLQLNLWMWVKSVLKIHGH